MARMDFVAREQMATVTGTGRTASGDRVRFTSDGTAWNASEGRMATAEEMEQAR